MKFAGNSFEDYFAAIRDKKVIIYGAGQLLKNIGKNYEELFPSDRIRYIVDKNEKKTEKKYQLNGTLLDIKTVNEFICDNGIDTVLLIAIFNGLDSVMRELNSYESLKDLPFFVLPQMISSHIDEIYDFSKLKPAVIENIPKKIHCCWFSGEKKDPLSELCLESWKRFCPDYEIIEWNTKNYDVEKNDFMFGAYKAKRWASVADYARFDVVKTYGGIYLDFDVELYQNLDCVLGNDFFIGFDGARAIEAAAFGGKKNSNVASEFLSIFGALEFPCDQRLVIPQPVYLTDFFKSKGMLVNGRHQQLDGATIYPKNSFSGMDYYTDDMVKDKTMLGYHHRAASWLSSDRKDKREASRKFIRELQREKYL